MNNNNSVADTAGSAIIDTVRGWFRFLKLWYRMTRGLRNDKALDTLIAELRVECQGMRLESKQTSAAYKDTQALLKALLVHRQDKGRAQFPRGSQHTITEDEDTYSVRVIDHRVERNGDLKIVVIADRDPCFAHARGPVGHSAGLVVCRREFRHREFELYCS
jgi:hypothetical protein